MQKTSTLVSTSGKSNKSKPQASGSVQIPEVSDSVVRAILNYSRSLSVRHSDSIGFIDIVAS